LINITMKLLLLLAVGAFAVQDTTPPVISLTLNGQSMWNGKGGFHTMHDHMAAARCKVHSSSAACPNPKCQATDHHDKNVLCR